MCVSEACFCPTRVVRADATRSLRAVGNNLNLFFGLWTDGPQQRFAGGLSDVAIASVAFTAGDVANLFNGLGKCWCIKPHRRC